MRLPCLCLIVSAVVTGSVLDAWKMTGSQKVTVPRGEDAVLGCSLTPGGRDYAGRMTVKWLERTLTSEPVFECTVKNDSMGGGSSCSGSELKYSLSGDPGRGEMSLLIRKVELTNNGSFFCTVKLEENTPRRGKNYFVAKIDLCVEAKPEILSLSVVHEPCGSGSALRWLRCEFAGHPLPQIVWLNSSRRMLEPQGPRIEMGPYRGISCVPYHENEVLTCRVESPLDTAERTYPHIDSQPAVLVVVLIVAGLVVMMMLSTGLVCFCMRKKRLVSNPPADEGETPQAIYSVIESQRQDSSSQPVNFLQPGQQNQGEDALYYSVTM